MSSPSLGARAIKLASDPTNFTSPRPIRTFEIPGDAKFEADAHLTVCIDGIANALVNSSDLETRFRNIFHDVMLGRPDCKPGMRNSQLPLLCAAKEFNHTFRAVYRNQDIIGNVFRSMFGRRTTQACYEYMRCVNEAFPDLSEQQLRALRVSHYINPMSHIINGINTVGNTAEATIMAAARLESPETAADRIGQLDEHWKAHGTLSLAQINRAGLIEPDKVLRSETMCVHPNVKARRDSEAHDSKIAAAVRPHTGCPAMPGLPAIGELIGGSGIRLLSAKAGQLIIATNMHATRDDRPQYQVFPAKLAA